jgi:3-hydroxyisobutyrate dehydrogenase-like beta-hydroxyacid dehydrogenase
MKVHSKTVGMIGLGLMGTVMSRRLMAAGFEVIGFDVRSDARTGLEAEGGKAVGDIAEVARRCAVAVLSVFDTGQVEDVLEGAGGILAVGTRERMLGTVINTSTCDPDRIAALAVRAGAG